MNDSIFTIVMIREDQYGRILERCVGWFPSRYYAAQVLISNDGDINENGYYKYAVIEEWASGIYKVVKNTWFYQFDQYGYIEILDNTHHIVEWYYRVCGLSFS